MNSLEITLICLGVGYVIFRFLYWAIREERFNNRMVKRAVKSEDDNFFERPAIVAEMKNHFFPRPRWWQRWF